MVSCKRWLNQIKDNAWKSWLTNVRRKKTWEVSAFILGFFGYHVFPNSQKVDMINDEIWYFWRAYHTKILVGTLWMFLIILAIHTNRDPLLTLFIWNHFRHIGTSYINYSTSLTTQSYRKQTIGTKSNLQQSIQFHWLMLTYIKVSGARFYHISKSVPNIVHYSVRLSNQCMVLATGGFFYWAWEITLGIQVTVREILIKPVK